MKTFLNYFGQLRIYSLLDLVLLLIAIHAGYQDLFGILFLHIGFLAFLESRHSHTYRRKIPKWLWMLFTFIGICLYRHWEVVPLLLVSYLYVKKTEKYFGSIALIFRGFQYFFLVAGILGYQHYLAWISLIVIFIRNFTGDLRDIEKDRIEGLKTLPILLGLKNDIKVIHLITILFTSYIWWSFTSIPFWILIMIFLTQIFTYKITPR